MKLYKVKGGITEGGFYKLIDSMEVEQTGKSYVGEGKRISKDKIMKIDTIWREHHNSIQYHTYCLEGQQQEALNMLKAHIIAKVKKYKAEIDNLYKYLPE